MLLVDISTYMMFGLLMMLNLGVKLLIKLTIVKISLAEDLTSGRLSTKECFISLEVLEQRLLSDKCMMKHGHIHFCEDEIKLYYIFYVLCYLIIKIECLCERC